MDLERAQQHTVDALRRSRIEKDGFEWVAIQNLFPDDVYQELMGCNLQTASEHILEIFDNPNFVKLLFEKFRDSPLRSDLISSIYTFWQRAGAGYSLKPHCDSYPRVFTMTVYLADDDSSPEAGTAIYSVDKFTKKYETLAVAPFVRNSCKIIAPYDNLTWHGVNLIKEPVDRKSVVTVFSDQEWDENQLHYATWKPGRTVKYHG